MLLQNLDDRLNLLFVVGGLRQGGRHHQHNLNRAWPLFPRIVVVDDDVNVRDWADVIWAITTRVDPTRDTLLADNTPIDYLDFASPVSGLGSKMGMDATHKWPGETTREWGKPLSMSAAVTARVEQVWQTLVL